MITTHKVFTNKKQGPGRGHPWSSDRNRAEFPVSAWEVKLKTMKLQKEIGLRMNFTKSMTLMKIAVTQSQKNGLLMEVLLKEKLSFMSLMVFMREQFER